MERNKGVAWITGCIYIMSLLANLYVAYAEEGRTGTAAPGQIIVRYKQTQGTLSAASAFTAENSVQVLDQIADAESVYTLYQVPADQTEEITEKLNQNELVEFAEPNYRIQAANTDPEFSKQWGLGLGSAFGIDAQKAWAVTEGAAEVVVAVIDSGVDINHPDLAGNIYRNPNETANQQDSDGNGFVDDINGWDFTAGDNTVYDGEIIDGENADAHGTHVAGIIAAAHNDIGIQGVAPNIKIMPLKVMNGEEGTVFDAMKAIEYAERMGVKIANCSWTTEAFSQFLYDCMRRSDILFVCAAGNYGLDLGESPFYPAAYDLENVLTVAAVDQNGAIAEFSNFGQGTDIAAPGQDIYSTLPGGTYGYLDGTSMAAPFVTGTAALLQSMLPGLGAAELKSRILSTAAAGNGLEEAVQTGGYLNAGNAVLMSIEPAALPDSRYGAAYITADNQLYAAGGFDGTQYLRTIERYVPAADSWETIGQMPEAAAQACAVYHQNRLFVLGGTGGTIKDQVSILDLATGQVTAGADLPQPLYAMYCAVYGDSIYVFGGVGEDGYMDTVYAYDILNDVWEQKASLPFPAAYGKAVEAGGSIYLLGGCNGDGCIQDIYTYDFSTEQPQYKTHLTVPRKDFAAAVYRDHIYIFGGSASYTENGENTILDSGRRIHMEALTNTVECYDPAQNVCVVVDRTKNPKAGAGAAVYFGNIYLLGGWNGSITAGAEKYFGTCVPENIQLRTGENSSLEVTWDPVDGATAYEIEINGEISQTSMPAYTAVVDESVENAVRVRAVQGERYSLWSDYQRQYLHATILDAKLIGVNSQTDDKLYHTGQSKWYRLDTASPGEIKLTLSNIPQGCDYLLQLCNSSGEPIAYGQTKNNYSQTIDGVLITQYNYYVKVTSIYGGDPQSSYLLTAEFSETNKNTIPDRIRSAFLQPADMGDQWDEEVELTNFEEYDGPEPSPAPREAENSAVTLTDTSVRGATMMMETIGNTRTVEAIDGGVSAQAADYTYDFETGQIGTINAIKNYSVDIAAGSIPSNSSLKLAICVEPENPGDTFTIRWSSEGTSDAKLAWNEGTRDGKPVNFITGLFRRVSGTYTFKYTVKCTNKAPGSQGRYTLHIYQSQSRYTNEDYTFGDGVNDMPSTAKRVSASTNGKTSYQGTIDHPYDGDCYKINLESGQKLTVMLTPPAGKNYWVGIYDNRCAQTTGTSVLEPEESLDSWVNSDGVAFATIVAKKTQTYCIFVVSDGEMESYAPDSPYTLDIYCYNYSVYGSYEPNDVFESADLQKDAVAQCIGGPGKVSEDITFCIDSPVDVDRYAVDLAAGDKLSINMEMPADYDDSAYAYRVQIHKLQTDKPGYYTEYSYNNPNSPQVKFVTFIPEESGTYYVAVSSKKEKEVNGEAVPDPQYNYRIKGTLNITKTPKASLDAYEEKPEESSNDFVGVTIGVLGDVLPLTILTAQDITSQSQISANFDNELDVDWYRFENTQGAGTVTFRVDGGDALLNAAQMIVLDGSYQILSADRFSMAYDMLKGQTYYIGLYVDDGAYKNILADRDYTVTLDRNHTRSNLIFEPLRWGTFVYDNSPEFLLEDDLADYNLGNKLLMTADNLTGVIDVQTSHSVQPFVLQGGSVSFDILLYNPTAETITVDLLQYGAQAPYETLDWGSNATSSQWACLQAWADYYQYDLEEDSFIHFERFMQSENIPYKPYQHQNMMNQLPNKGHYVIAPGETQWLMGDLRLTLSTIMWSPMNIAARLRTDGTVNVAIAAFRNVNNVYTPQPPELIYDSTQRDYPAGIQPEDLSSKYKGVSKSVAEVEARTSWVIDDATTYFTPTVYNMANPTGYTIAQNGATEYWCTNYNTNQDSSSFNNGVESDILPLVFSDSTQTWYFDTRHTTPINGNEKLTGIPPISNAMVMGNYGVVTRYYIDIQNTSNLPKTIRYSLGTGSHAYITYKWENEIKWQRVVKCWIPQCGAQEFFSIFEVTIPKNSKNTLIFEVLLPNADNGAFKNKLEVV